jgi:hypothetical protein
MLGVVEIPLCRVHFFRAIFILLVSGVCSGQTRRNVTVDSSSPLIHYSPSSSWSEKVANVDAGGEHMMTQAPNAYASINMTCEFYASSPRKLLNLNNSCIVLDYVCKMAVSGHNSIYYRQQQNFRHRSSRSHSSERGEWCRK